MTTMPLSTNRHTVASEMGQFLSAIFRNGDAGFGGYIVRLMLIGNTGRSDLSVKSRLMLKHSGFSSTADYIQPGGGTAW